jgi:hypothetical protein
VTNLLILAHDWALTFARPVMMLTDRRLFRTRQFWRGVRRIALSPWGLVALLALRMAARKWGAAG